MVKITVFEENIFGRGLVQYNFAYGLAYFIKRWVPEQVLCTLKYSGFSVILQHGYNIPS
jgi:hypothetical protein